MAHSARRTHARTLRVGKNCCAQGFRLVASAEACPEPAALTGSQCASGTGVCCSVGVPATEVAAHCCGEAFELLHTDSDDCPEASVMAPSACSAHHLCCSVVTGEDEPAPLTPPPPQLSACCNPGYTHTPAGHCPGSSSLTMRSRCSADRVCCSALASAQQARDWWSEDPDAAAGTDDFSRLRAQWPGIRGPLSRR